MKLEKMFRRVHANPANLFHGRSPLFEICNDLILAQSMPSGAVHPITRCDLTNDAVQLPSLWSSHYSRAVVIQCCRIERVFSMKFRTRIITGALITVVVLLGGGVAANWAPDKPLSVLAARWAPPPSTFVPILGMQVHLRDEGPREDPTPIVLIHGTSASLHTWEGWVAALKDDRRVITFDLPGFGLTGPSPDGDYTIAAYVQLSAARPAARRGDAEAGHRRRDGALVLVCREVRFERYH
jgi:hypothetical protein